MVWFCVAMLPTVGPKVVGISFLGQHALSMIETCIKHRSLFLAVRLWYPLTLWKSCIVGSSGVFPWFLFRILEIIVMRFCWWNLPRAGNLYISALKTKSDPFNAHICMCIYIYISNLSQYIMTYPHEFVDQHPHITSESCCWKSSLSFPQARQLSEAEPWTMNEVDLGTGFYWYL